MVLVKLGVSKAWGPLSLELIPGITFFTNSNDFFGGKTLEQDPIYSLQGHLIYEFSPAFWAAFQQHLLRRRANHRGPSESPGNSGGVAGCSPADPPVI